MAESDTVPERQRLGDESSRRRVAFARQLLALARDQAREPEPVCYAALLTLHDAAELFLVAARVKHDVGRADMTFPDLFNPLQQSLGLEISHRVSMIRLNSARRELKHRGTLPHQQELSEFVDITEAFFRDNSLPLFGFDLREATLVEFVEPSQARAYLREAEAQIDSEEFEEAALNIARGWALVEKHYRIDPGRRWFSTQASQLMLVFDEDHRLKRYLEELERSVMALGAEVSAMRAGVDTQEYERFRSLLPVVANVAMSGAVHLSVHGPLDVPREDLISCVDYVVRIALRLRQRSSS